MIVYAKFLHQRLVESSANNLSIDLLDQYLRLIKVLCKGQIYKDDNNRVLDIWHYYQNDICPIVTNLPFDMRVTGKYIFISMFLEADIGFKV